MDVFDQAQEMDAIFRNRAIELHRKRMEAIGDTMTHCIDCGDEIPEARRTILPGCTHCVHCAEKIEESERRR